MPLVLKNFYFHPLHRMFGHMHEVLNVDGKKPIAQSWGNHETNLLSLISPWKALSATVPICANDGLISIIRFVSQFPDGFCNLFFLLVSENPSRHHLTPLMWHPKIFISQTKQNLSSKAAFGSKLTLRS
jgi:hypothetical protein